MAELYTSLVRLKQALNGGQMPPMTPIPEKIQHIIDPDLTPGFGALHEDEARGLRCPVRGCGRFTHFLTLHANTAHRDIGGAPGIKKLLDIPQGARLISQRLRAQRQQTAASNPVLRAHARKIRDHPGRHTITAEERRRGQVVKKTMSFRNFQDHCTAQLTHRIIDLRNKIGRIPSAPDFRATYGPSMLSAVTRAFGTWNNALVQCGFGERGFRRRTSVDDVLTGLRAWHEVHGSLPSARQTEAGVRSPAIHGIKTIKSAFGTESYADAMRQAAAILGIEGGRYGLPPRKGAA